MPAFFKCFSIFLLLNMALYAQKKDSIYFSPLPLKNTAKNIQDFLPLTSYLEEKINTRIKYIHKNNYKDIIEDFEEGKIDIAYLGPLPYIALKKKYPFIKPIATIKQNNGTTKYRCVLTKFKSDTIDISKPIKVALTQPLSTCGYYMTQELLKQNLQVELKEQQFSYKMSHSNAILSVLEGNYILAGVKDTIAKKYKSVGMEIIAQSEPLAGFLLVGNLKTLSLEQIKQLKKEILNIEPSTYKKWSGVFSNGFIKTNTNEYDLINVEFNNIPLKGNIK